MLVMLRSQLCQKLVHAFGNLLIAFSIGKWGVECRRSHGFDVCPRTSGEVAIITFAKPSILENRDRRTLKNETGGLVGPLGVRRKNDIEGLVRVLTAENRPRLLPPNLS